MGVAMSNGSHKFPTTYYYRKRPKDCLRLKKERKKEKSKKKERQIDRKKEREKERK